MSESKPRALPPWATVPRPWLSLAWFIAAPWLILFVTHARAVIVFVIAWAAVAVAGAWLMEMRARRQQQILRHGDLAHGKVTERSRRLGKSPSVALTIRYGKNGEHELAITVPDRAEDAAWRPLAELEVGDPVTLAVDPKEPSRAAVLAAK